jgi:hypothetical protein
MKHRIALAATAAALLVLPATALAAMPSSPSPAATPSPAAPSTVDWQIPLAHSAAFPTATGSAQYQAQPGQKELQIEVERLKSLAGSTVRFYANGIKIGAARVSALGTAQVTLNSELGQSVPTILHGSVVSARTATGVLIAAGTF